MKRLLFVFFTAFFAATAVNSQTTFDPINAEVIANRLKENQAITKQQGAQAVNYALIGLSKVETGGELLLDMYPAGSEWETFHDAFERIEEEYQAVFVIIKHTDVLKKVVAESLYAKLTIKIREYNSWYSRFCSKQKVYTDCPYQ